MNNNPMPVDVLESRAAQQRRQLHDSVVELKSTLRQRMDVKRNLREHFWPASGVAAAVGLLAGYTAARIFTRA